MESPLQIIVAKRLEELGINPFEAARAGGLERSFVNDILTGRKRSVRSDKIEQLALGLQLDPKDLASDIATPKSVTSVPLMGRVGAGAEVEPDFEQVPEDGLDQIELPFTMPADMIALEVQGDSMLPMYDPGTIIIVYREQRRSIESFFGQRAVVRTTDGRRYIKTIIKGEGGLVSLLSWNAQAIQDVEVAWIGEIFTYFPATAVRHMTRQIARQGGIQGRLQLKTA